jgi:hypothetical protein
MAQESNPAPERKLEFVKAPDGIRHIYTNNFAIGHTVLDIRLIFGELTDIDDKKIEITQRVAVTMTWLEAKALSESLAAYVKNYEDSYGPIKTEFTPLQNPKMPEIPKILPPKP